MKATIFVGQQYDSEASSKHPLTESISAKELIDSSSNFSRVSNSPDFCSFIKYYGEKNGYEISFILNGTNVGNDLEAVFEDFNRSFDYLDSNVMNNETDKKL